MNNPQLTDQLEDVPQLSRKMAMTSPKVPSAEEFLDRFWECGPELDEISIQIEPPEAPLEILEKLGPSPFPRGSFPVIGFLATTYDKVSRYALERV